MKGLLPGRAGPHDFRKGDTVRVVVGWGNCPVDSLQVVAEVTFEGENGGDVYVEGDPWRGGCSATRFELVADAQGNRPPRTMLSAIELEALEAFDREMEKFKRLTDRAMGGDPEAIAQLSESAATVLSASTAFADLVRAGNSAPVEGLTRRTT